MSKKAIGKTQADVPSHILRQFKNTDSVESTGTCRIEFPVIASQKLKNNIIREWQQFMDYDDMTRHPCAVCAQNMSRRDVVYVHPDEIDFTLLQNICLPAETLPTSYNLKAYDNAILYPKGLHDLQMKGPLDMCATCYSSLVERKKQPLDALANFQYYAVDELPVSVKETMTNTSMFDLMLVSRARATRITHLFSKKKDSLMLGQELQNLSATVEETWLFCLRTTFGFANVFHLDRMKSISACAQCS